MTESRYEVRCHDTIRFADDYESAGELGEKLVRESEFQTPNGPAWHMAYITNQERGQLELQLFYSPSEGIIKGLLHFRHTKACADCGNVIPSNQLVCANCAVNKCPSNPAGAPRKPWSKRNRPDTGDNFLFDGTPLRIH